MLFGSKSSLFEHFDKPLEVQLPWPSIGGIVGNRISSYELQKYMPRLRAIWTPRRYGPQNRLHRKMHLEDMRSKCNGQEMSRTRRRLYGFREHRQMIKTSRCHDVNMGVRGTIEERTFFHEKPYDAV